MTFVIEEGFHKGMQSEKPDVVEVELGTWSCLGTWSLLQCSGWLWTGTAFIFQNQNKWYCSRQDGIESRKVNFSSMTVARQEILYLKMIHKITLQNLYMCSELKMQQGFIILNNKWNGELKWSEKQKGPVETKGQELFLGFLALQFTAKNHWEVGQDMNLPRRQIRSVSRSLKWWQDEGNL